MRVRVKIIEEAHDYPFCEVRANFARASYVGRIEAITPPTPRATPTGLGRRRF